MAVSRITTAPQLKELVLERVPAGRDRAIRFGELCRHFPDHHYTAIQRALRVLILWGDVRRELRRNAGVDALGRPRSEFVYWRESAQPPAHDPEVV